MCGALAAVCASMTAQTGFAQSSPDALDIKADLTRWKTELSNWGRWGAHDEIGALNLVTPAKRRQAAALVEDGVSVSLSRDMDFAPSADNPWPFEREFTRVGIDNWSVRFHGYGMTHLDALVHVFDDGVGYNGYTPDEQLDSTLGHPRSSVHLLKAGVVTRGVLVDLPRLKGVEYLEPGTSIYPQDLEDWETRTGTRVTAGDALFIRAGRWARRATMGPWSVDDGRAGLHPSCIPWLRERDVALIGTEAPLDVAPAVGGLYAHAVHNFLLVYLGVHLFDNVDMEDLAKAAAERERWEFMLTVAPLAVPGATGSPVNPIATF